MYSTCNIAYGRHILFVHIFLISILYYTILYFTILYYTLLYCTVLCCAVLYYTILYYTLLYYTILYYTIRYYTLYLTILYLSNMELAVFCPGSFSSSCGRISIAMMLLQRYLTRLRKGWVWFGSQDPQGPRGDHYRVIGYRFISYQNHQFILQSLRTWLDGTRIYLYWEPYLNFHRMPSNRKAFPTHFSFKDSYRPADQRWKSFFNFKCFKNIWLWLWLCLFKGG